jgi:hypothetical protein
MNYFLQESDFYGTYTEDRFNKLITDSNGQISAQIWKDQSIKSIDEASDFLISRYDLSRVFSPLIPFADTTTFNLYDRVKWTVSDTYSESSTYAIGDLVVYSGDIYRCKTEILVGEAFDPAKWTYIAVNGQLYECIAESTGNDPDDTDYFTEGDPRKPKLVEVIVDITLYYLLQRLNAIDIPVNRKERYDGNTGNQTGGAIGWLKMIAKGFINPDLPLLETNQEDQTGNKIIYGYAEDVHDENTTF